MSLKFQNKARSKRTRREQRRKSARELNRISEACAHL